LYDLDELKSLLIKPELSRQDKVLLVLGLPGNDIRAVAEIKTLALQAGLRAIKNWNISDLLVKSNGLAIHTGSGWELTREGKIYTSNIAGASGAKPTSEQSVSDLRSHLTRITNTQTQSFVEEAIACFEAGYYRAAVVLSWVGAMAVIYDHTVANDLAGFNTEATKRNKKWKSAKTTDDLAEMGEYDFLQIIRAISIVGRNVKTELEGCLKLRNSCGHPNTLQIGKNKAAAHIETLVLNVFSAF